MYYTLHLIKVIENIDIWIEIYREINENKLHLNAGELETVKYLIAKGADVHSKDNAEYTDLHHATGNGMYNVHT